ncbi:Hypothetical_protein [Hexamita inflata]|uniref:Hypothetical_protein n=1 Tax=Hexamita inflata TaxID=28002 RepID=A0ABP1HPF9_9EUKA
MSVLMRRENTLIIEPGSDISKIQIINFILLPNSKKHFEGPPLYSQYIFIIQDSQLKPSQPEKPVEQPKDGQNEQKTITDAKQETKPILTKAMKKKQVKEYQKYFIQQQKAKEDIKASKPQEIAYLPPAIQRQKSMAYTLYYDVTISQIDFDKQKYTNMLKRTYLFFRNFTLLISKSLLNTFLSFIQTAAEGVDSS